MQSPSSFHTTAILDVLLSLPAAPLKSYTCVRLYATETPFLGNRQKLPGQQLPPSLHDIQQYFSHQPQVKCTITTPIQCTYLNHTNTVAVEMMIVSNCQPPTGTNPNQPPTAHPPTATNGQPQTANCPSWDPTTASKLLHQALSTQTGFKPEVPTWDEFRAVLRQPTSKAPAPDKFGPHLLNWLPEDLQWDLYLAICAVWESQKVPEEWLLSRVTLIYKKCSTQLALNYRPISVSCCMYLLISRLLLHALKEPLEKSLSYTSW